MVGLLLLWERERIPGSAKGSTRNDNLNSTLGRITVPNFAFRHDSENWGMDMDLRSQLTPPQLDQSLVDHLAELADRLDGARPGEWDEDLAEFNRLAGTNVPFVEFQGIYGAGAPEDFVRSVLSQPMMVRDPNLTIAEMTEIVSRILTGRGDTTFYVALFNANCRHPSGSDLIFYPDEIAGMPLGREATAEEIARLAMQNHA